MGKGGGGSAAAAPSTTTQIQDIPAWEQGYVQNLLGQAQTEAAQPYQQFQGPQIAGFTGDQTQAFSNIENAGSFNAANQANALRSANAGANTANNIYNAGQGYINQATQYNPLAAISPYLQNASQYNSASAAQPWLNQAAGYTNAAANAATPQGIQAYLSPYTQNVVGGIENEANQNWNQNIMPGVNDKFIGSGGFAGGRNAQVLGQAAGNFQTGLSANVSNALNTGYTNATQAAQAQAGIYGNLAATSLNGATTAGGAQTSQINNLMNQANAAGTATQQQANNLQTAGNNLGALANTQASAQLNAGNTLSNIGTQSAQTNLAQNTALQGIGQQQQQLNQANIDQAKTDFENQVNYPEAQTQFLNQIIRGLPAPTASTSQSQTPAYSVSPLAGIGGSITSALAAVGHKEGGLVQGYAKGGKVAAQDNSGDDNNDYEDDVDDNTDYGDDETSSPLENVGSYSAPADAPTNDNASLSPLDTSSLNDNTPPASDNNSDSPLAAVNPTAPGMISDTQSQKLQLLKLAQGMLTPTFAGQGFAALGQGIGNMADVQEQVAKQNAAQQAINSQRAVEQRRLDIAQQRADSYITKGAGANDTIARGLMQDHPGLSYTDAIRMVMNKNIPGGSASSFNSPAQGGTAQAGATSPTNPAPTLSVKTLPQDYQDRLSQIPDEHRNTVMGILSGSVKVSKQTLGNNVDTYLKEAEFVDPTYDSTKAEVRSSTAQEFGQKGATGKAITGLNGAALHAAEVYSNIRDLGNQQYPLLNMGNNAADQHLMGKDNVGNLRTSIGILSPEIAKATTGKPNFTGEESKSFGINIPLDGSLEQQLGGLNTMGHMAVKKVGEYQDKYNTDMGPFGSQKQFISPTSQQIFADLDTVHAAAKNGKLDDPEVIAADKRLRAAASIKATQTPATGTAPSTGAAPKGNYSKYAPGTVLKSPSAGTRYQVQKDGTLLPL